MPNDQQHDPRVSTAPERLAVARTLSVSAIASSGAGGTSVFAYLAQAGIADGELITLTTDGSEGWDFGPAPTELATMGFGQGLLYTAAEGPNFQAHTDPFSGSAWTWERADFSPDRYIVTEEGIRALRADVGGGFVNYLFSQYLPENTKLFISTLSKSNYDFVNKYFGDHTEYAEILSVSSGSVELTAPWPYASDTNSFSTTLAADVNNIDAGFLSTGGTFTNGSATVLVDDDPVAAGVQPGWVIGPSELSQWKGVRLSDTGGFGSSDATPLENNIYMTPNNGTTAGFNPTRGRWTYLQPNNVSNFPSDMFYKGWSRNDQQLKYGTFGNVDGEISGNIVTPDENYVRYNQNLTTGLNLHDTNRRTGAASWQDFTVGILNKRLHRTDFFVQIGTFARVEISDGDSPETATSSFLLPPVIADWSATSITVLLWKSLFTNYEGKFIHFFDADGTFRKAVAL